LNSSNLKKIVLIGASTGGPGLIENIIKALPSSINVPIIIAQHMDSLSLKSFAKRLERIHKIEVCFVETSVPVISGKIYVLCDTTRLVDTPQGVFLEPYSEQKGFYHPTIDELFESATQLRGVSIVSYLLSGIGADGAKGMLCLKEKGHKTIAQDEKSSIVYGMPKSAYELGATTQICSINAIIEQISKEV